MTLVQDEFKLSSHIRHPQWPKTKTRFRTVRDDFKQQHSQYASSLGKPWTSTTLSNNVQAPWTAGATLCRNAPSNKPLPDEHGAQQLCIKNMVERSPCHNYDSSLQWLQTTNGWWRWSDCVFIPPRRRKYISANYFLGWRELRATVLTQVTSMISPTMDFSNPLHPLHISRLWKSHMDWNVPKLFLHRFHPALMVRFTSELHLDVQGREECNTPITLSEKILTVYWRLCWNHFTFHQLPLLELKFLTARNYQHTTMRRSKLASSHTPYCLNYRRATLFFAFQDESTSRITTAGYNVKSWWTF